MDSTCIIFLLFSFQSYWIQRKHSSLETLLPTPSDKSTYIKTPAQVLQIPKWGITLHKPNGCSSLTSCTDSKPQRHSQKWLHSVAFCLPHSQIERHHEIPSLLSALELPGKPWGPGCSGWPTPAARALGGAVLLPASLLLCTYACLRTI